MNPDELLLKTISLIEDAEHYSTSSFFKDNDDKTAVFGDPRITKFSLLGALVHLDPVASPSQLIVLNSIRAVMPRKFKNITDYVQNSTHEEVITLLKTLLVK